MGMRWLCSSVIIIVIISTTNTQNVVNKWKIEDRKDSSSTGGTSGRIETKKSSTYRKPKEANYAKQFEKLFLNTEVNHENAKHNENVLSDEKSSKAHSRKKRIIGVTDDGRLALPPGTVLSISPTLSLPLVRYPPTGFLSNITLSFPLTIDFDKLGLTDNQNPLGVLPPIFGRSMGRAAGSMLANYIGTYLHSRTKRDTSDKLKNSHITVTSEDDVPELPEEQKHVFHGGERALLYGVVEDLIGTFGLNGKACLLRTICEVHSNSVLHLGLFGEMAKLFFTASKSKFSDMLPEYVLAEKMGEGSLGPGECFPYYKDCPRGLFKTERTRYSDPNEVAADDHQQSEHQGGEPIIQLESNEINEINSLESDRWTQQYEM